MQQKFNVILADASCLILLDKIGEFDLLHSVFGSITTTSTIALEYGKALPPWIAVHPDPDPHSIESIFMEVDAGEASLIALAMEMPDALLILDDQKARMFAKRLGLTFTGTLGVMLKAKELGIIRSVQSMLGKVQQTNFRFSEQVLQHILKLSGEVI
jgi:predicted nucleic acid-binding protein